MEKSLKETEAIFNQKLKETSSVEESLNLFERYYNFLYQKVVDDTPTAEYYFYNLLSKACKFVKGGGFTSKSVSKNWNGGLAYRTIEFLKWYRNEEKGKAFNTNSAYTSKFGVLYESIVNEKDFISKIYCLSMLEAEGLTRFAKLAKEYEIPIEETAPVTNVE